MCLPCSVQQTFMTGYGEEPSRVWDGCTESPPKVPQSSPSPWKCNVPWDVGVRGMSPAALPAKVPLTQPGMWDAVLGKQAAR